MSKKTNPAAVGAFVVGAVVLAVASVILFGSGKLLQKVTKCVMYFDSSLGGLDVGAPVEFQGVKVGTVSDITLIYDHGDESFRIPVVVEIQTDAAVEVGGTSLTKEREDVQTLIGRGLRARLTSQSVVTGKLKIELGFHPDAEIKLVEDTTGLPQIPTLPKTLDAITKKLQDLPLAEIVQDTHRLIEGLADVAGNADTRKTVTNLNDTLIDIQEVLDGLEASIPDIAANLNEAVHAASESLQRLEATLDTDSPLQYEAHKAFQEVSRASRALTQFLETLDRDPGALLHGRSN